MIAIRDLTVDLGDFVLQDATFEVRAGEYFIILGPTGAGKTVLLETIAGLFPARGGEVWIDGRNVTDLEPEKRGIAFVYQDHVLFPHLSVWNNIIFGLKRRKKSRDEIEETANWAVDLLRISHLVKRKPDTLSGGEKQKVALARALVVQPRVLLLDEPVSALDPETRETVQRQLRRIHDQLDLTIIHVTHDFEEAVSLGDRIAVIGQGRVIQVGTPEQIFRRPNSEFVARFAMARNVTTADVEGGENGRAFARIGEARLEVLTDLRGRCHLSLRPEDILVSTEPFQSSARNSFRGIITDILDRGSMLYLTVDVPPVLICLITRRSFEEMNLREGGEVYATFKASAVHVF
ncbi:MAG: ABC transporter ATP-binding protein [Dehalococcoidia bacterium]